jgi:hypothetical protein
MDGSKTGPRDRTGAGFAKAEELVERFWALSYDDRRLMMADLKLIPSDYRPRNERQTYKEAMIRCARQGRLREFEAVLDVRSPKH